MMHLRSAKFWFYVLHQTTDSAMDRLHENYMYNELFLAAEAGEI